MKKNIVLTACLVFVSLFCVSYARAENQFGVGVILGDPTGLSVKYNLNKLNSIDGAFAWTGSSYVHLHGDYLWNQYNVFYVDKYPFDLFYGVGGRLVNPDHDKYSGKDADTHLAVRAPIGIRYLFTKPRIEVFTELALLLDLIPSSGVDLDFGLGARFFF